MTHFLPPIAMMQTARRLALGGLLATSLSAWAGPQIDLTAEASREAANDLAHATLFGEASGPRASEAARTVNGRLADALRLCKQASAMQCRTGSTMTWPVHGKSGRIEGWRVRSELVVESANLAGFSDLVGRLQESLAVSHISLRPAAATRKQAEDAAIVDALAAFRTRASLIADAMGKPYRITRLNVQTQPNMPIPVMRTMMMKAEAAPMPVEAGEATISVTVSGQIEVAD